VLVRFPDDVAPILKETLDPQGLVIKFFTEPGFIGYSRISLGTREENARLREAIRLAWPAQEARAAAGGEEA